MDTRFAPQYPRVNRVSIVPGTRLPASWAAAGARGRLSGELGGGRCQRPRSSELIGDALQTLAGWLLVMLQMAAVM